MNAKSMTNWLPTFNMILFKNLRPSLSLSLPSRQDMRILVLTAANKIRKGKAIFFLIMWKNVLCFYILYSSRISVMTKITGKSRELHFTDKTQK